MVFRTRTHRMFVNVTNMEGPDQLLLQKQSNLGLHCLSRPLSTGN